MGYINAEIYDAFIEAGASDAKAKAAAATVPDSQHLATKEDIAKLRVEIAGHFTTLYRYQLGFAAAIVAAIVAIDRFLG